MGCCTSELKPIDRQDPHVGGDVTDDRLNKKRDNRNMKTNRSDATSRTDDRTNRGDSSDRSDRRDRGDKTTKREKTLKRNDSAAIIATIVDNPTVGEALKSVPIFASLDKKERDKIGGAMTESVFQPNQLVFNEGDASDTFYVIKKGIALVSQPSKGNTTLCQLHAGSYFGAQSILKAVKRNCAIRADSSGPLTLWTLDKVKFLALFQKHRVDVVFAERRRLAVTAEAMSVSSKSQDVRLSEMEQVKFRNKMSKNKMSTSTRELVINAIHESRLFKGIDKNQRQAVVDLMTEQIVEKGETVIREGEEGDKFYVVVDGEFDVFQHDKDDPLGPDKKVDNKKTGSSFGELALMYDAPRNATCTAAVRSTVRVLERIYFSRVMRDMEEARLNTYYKWLKQVPLLAPLGSSERYQLAEALEEVVYPARKVIFKQGDSGEAMFFVIEGEVQFSAKNKETGVEENIKGQHGTCGPGGYFGERALVNNSSRMASVTTRTECRLLRVDRATFETLLGPLEQIMRKRENEYDENTKHTFKWTPANVKLSDLVVEGFLGRGSYGYVQLVKDPATGIQYALKAVSKQRVVETHQKQHIFNEKNLLAKLDHPFLVKLHATFSDKDLIYFLLEPSLGGELFRILRRVRAFPGDQARFYAGCVLLGFEHLHQKNMIYRDLKPENLLLTADGYIKITDFGFCKELSEKNKTWTMCGTPEYMAPEIIQSKGHGKGVDWWALGILIYEMLVSYTPFYKSGGDIMAMYERIARGHIHFPPHLSKDAVDIITELLRTKPTTRLGVVQGGARLIKQHPWFKNMDFKALERQELKAPLKASPEQISQLANFSHNNAQFTVKAYVPDGTDWDKHF